MPRSVSQAANGSAVAPSSTARAQTARWHSRSAKTATPPITSEWPPRYLVVEWITMSAPCSIGRQSSGEARELSTTPVNPAARPAASSAGRSLTWVIGLAMVSR